jgi:hypothetical protein
MKIKLRPKVQAFAEAMETILQQNDYKGGWQGCSNRYLLKSIEEEIDEAAEYINALNVINRMNRVSKSLDKKLNAAFCHELIDIANLIMMVWDNNQPE